MPGPQAEAQATGGLRGFVSHGQQDRAGGPALESTAGRAAADGVALAPEGPHQGPTGQGLAGRRAHQQAEVVGQPCGRSGLRTTEAQTRQCHQVLQQTIAKLGQRIEATVLPQAVLGCG